MSVRFFRDCVVGHECFFKCWAIELVSERCILSLLDRVVDVKPTYILLLSEIQSSKGHLNWYILVRRSYIVVICKNKSYITFVIDPPLMMAQSRAESTRDTYNYGQYINKFPPNTIKVIREFERVQKNICRHKMSIMFNEICIYIYIYIYWRAMCPNNNEKFPKIYFRYFRVLREAKVQWLLPATNTPMCTNI